MSRIVIVPPAPPPPQDEIFRVDGFVSANLPDGTSIPIRHNLTALRKPVVNGLNDPFYDYMSFYGAGYGQMVETADEVIEHKFWQRSDLTDWIEANLTGTVVVQRNTGYNHGWRIGFTRADDYHRFVKWWSVVGLRGYFETDTDEPTYNEMQVWLKENVRGGYRTKRAGYGYQPGNVKTVVIIRDLTEASAFQLFWPGRVKQAAAA